MRVDVNRDGVWLTVHVTALRRGEIGYAYVDWPVSQRLPVVRMARLT